MFSVRKSAKKRSNAGKIFHSLKKPAKVKNQKVKEVKNKPSHILGAVNGTQKLRKGRTVDNISQALPGSLSFFAKGFRSSIAQKKPGLELYKEKEKILNEDFYGLLQSSDANFNHTDNKNPQFSKDFIDIFTASPKNNFVNYESQNDGEVLKNCFSKVISTAKNNRDINCPENKTKSIFKEINDKYVQLLSSDFVKTEYRDTDNCLPNEFLEYRRNTVNGNFCKLLKQQLGNFDWNSALTDSISRIHSLVKNILSSNDNSELEMAEKKSNKSNFDDIVSEDAPNQLVPPSSWVFRTPNDQKLKQIPLEEPSIDLKPAILQTGEDVKVLYEIDEAVIKHVNLENYAGQKRMVPINPNITRQVCEVNFQNYEDDKFVHCRNKDSWQELIKNAGSSEDNSFKMPISKHRQVLRDTTNMVREVTDPNKKYPGFIRFADGMITCSTNNKVSPFKKDNRLFYTQRPMKTIKKSSRSFKKPPKKLTFEFDSKRQKLSFYNTSSGHERSESFNLDESQEAFNESFTCINNDSVVDMECSLIENYNVSSTSGSVLHSSDIDMSFCEAPQSSTTNCVGTQLCGSEVSYNLSEHFLSKITETPTFKLFPRRNYDGE